MTDDRTLLRRMRRGSENAAKQLWARHAPGLLLYARSMLSDAPIGGDDAVQQAFCRVFELSHARVRQVTDVRAWLTSVVRSIALNALRGESREHARRQNRAIAGGATCEQALSIDLELSQAIQRLAPTHREVVALRHLSELTFDQMSIALNENRSTVASRYRAALVQLRQHLAEPVPAPAQRSASKPVPLGESRDVV